jgi:hypothetical protein
MDMPQDPWLSEEAWIAEPSRSSVATVHLLSCIECLRPWLVPSERWRLKVTDELQRETVPYCPECAQREFGPGC